MATLSTDSFHSRSTRIVVTSGPAWVGEDAVEAMEEMVELGAEIVRLNLSNGTRQFYEGVLRASARARGRLENLVHFTGPWVRVASGEPLFLSKGQDVVVDLGPDDAASTASSVLRIHCMGQPLSELVKWEGGAGEDLLRVGDRILLSDGQVGLQVEEVHASHAVCRVDYPGMVRPHALVHFPDVDFSIDPISQELMGQLDWLSGEVMPRIGYLVLPLIHSREDFLTAREAVLERWGENAPALLADVSDRRSLALWSQIHDLADGVFLQRSSLCVDVAGMDVVFAQKQLLRDCRQRGKLSFVANDILESMIQSPRPPRNQLSDIVHAVEDGCDAIVLSAETAVGDRPFESVRALRTIVDRADNWNRDGVAAVEEQSFHSCFVSYGGEDQDFAERLAFQLSIAGVANTIFSRDARGGEKLHEFMWKGVNHHSRILLLCSESSLVRPGVLNEIEEVLAREGREGGRSVLIPIALDRYVFSDWSPERESFAQRIKDRVILDFSGAQGSHRKFTAAFERLLDALRVRD